MEQVKVFILGFRRRVKPEYVSCILSSKMQHP